MVLHPEQGGKTRRQFVQRAGLAVTGLALPSLVAACGSSTSSSGTTSADAGGVLKGAPPVTSSTLVAADFGGSTRDAIHKAFLDPLSQATGVQIQSADADYAKLILSTQHGHPSVDLTDMDGFEVAILSQQDVLERLPSWVDRRCDQIPAKFQEYGQGAYAYSFCISYRKDVLGASRKPETWADFWDTQRFPGKRAWPGFPLAAIEPALLADGVAPDELFPLDFDRAFAKLDEIRDDLVFYQSFAEAQQFMQSGSAPLGNLPNGRLVAMTDQNVPVEIVWNQALLTPWGAEVVSKGSPHADAAFAAMQFWSDPEHQAEFCRITSYGPTNSRTLDILTAREQTRLPNSPEHRSVAAAMDLEAFAKQNDEYNTRFTKWLSKA